MLEYVLKTPCGAIVSGSDPCIINQSAALISMQELNNIKLNNAVFETLFIRFPYNMRGNIIRKERKENEKKLL